MKAIVLVIIICIGVAFIAYMGRTAKIEETKTTRSYLDGNWVEVVGYGKRWVKNDPFNPVPHALLNLAYMKLDNQRAMKVELKGAFGTKERIKKVLRWSSDLVNANPNNPRPYWLKGLALEVDEEFQGAINTYNRGIAVDPLFGQNYDSLGNLYLMLGKIDEALKAYLPLLKIEGCQAVAYNHLGTIYVMKRNMPKALECFEKSVELDPKDLVGQNNLAGAYFDAGQTDELINTLLTISKLDPDGEIGDSARLKLRTFPK